MNTHPHDIRDDAPLDAPLSPHAAARRDAILADLLTRAPAIRRARATRRTARHAAIGAAPLLVIFAAVAITRAINPPPPTPGSPLAPIAAAPKEHPESTHTQPPQPLAHTPTAPDTDPRAADAMTARPTVRIVSTSGRSFEHMIAPARVRPELIDDDTLLSLLASEGKSEGIIHLQGRAILTSDLASSNTQSLPLPPSLSPPQSSL